ncbi:unnamed protein product [Calypogeia fissa]
MSGDRTARFFWLSFVVQGRQILESVSQVNLEEFDEGVNILIRIKQLYFHLTERGDKNKKYAEGLTEGKIANLFYTEEEVQHTIKEAVPLIPSHIYKLPGSGKIN